MPRKRRKAVPPKKSAKLRPITTQDLVQAVTSSPVVPPSDGVEPAVPPPLTGSANESANEQGLEKQENFKRLPPDSIVRTKAMHIIAMRMAGQTNAEIAKALDISERSIRQYVYLAGRNGWLTESENWADPADRLEFELSHKVISALDEALTDDTRNEKTGMPVKAVVALKIAEGTQFKKFGESQATPAQSNILAIKIQLPEGAKLETVREGAIAGIPRFVEGEVVDVSREAVE